MKSFAPSTLLSIGLQVDVWHEDASSCSLPSPLPSNVSDWLMVANVSMLNVMATVQGSTLAGCFNCAPGDRKCTGWAFTNVTVKNQNGSPAAPYTSAFISVMRALWTLLRLSAEWILCPVLANDMRKFFFSSKALFFIYPSLRFCVCGLRVMDLGEHG